eukprot:TRINITY_DN1329_c1_g1_i1.p1 TRINITY_DN1329_c1_g1~~TRINITY_DN1329_c1_g1_i1.p1  ORF type:complete len:538 (+),score=72.50 TRINITY_DN1329_c1_g1_i1:825-2438(+)
MSFFIVLSTLVFPVACKDVQIVFSTECTEYFDWQSNTLLWSIKQTYTKNNLEIPTTTRLTACDDEDKVVWDAFEDGWAGYSPSFSQFVHQTYNRGGGDCDNNDPMPIADCNKYDVYPAYNKPGSIIEWLKVADLSSTEFVVMLDADQIVRTPITVMDLQSLGIKDGRALSARYDYLSALDPSVYMGAKSRMLSSHDPLQRSSIERNFAKVGGIFVHTPNDLRAVAPNWLRYTRQVRSSTDSWAHTGDIFNCKTATKTCTGADCKCEKPPWISEMYGYSLSSAEAGVSHHISDTFMMYPGYTIHDDAPKNHPAVVHYGILYRIEVKSDGAKNYWCFDKHWYSQRESPMACDDSDKGRRVVFKQPPQVSDIVATRSSLFALECAWTIANATVDFLQAKCFGVKEPLLTPYSDQGHCVCDDPSDVSTCKDSLKKTVQTEDPDPQCTDLDTRPNYCCDWARNGECTTNRGYMILNCRRSCAFCLSAHSCLPQQQLTNATTVSWDSRKVSTATTPPSRYLIYLSASGWFVAALMLARIKRIL